MNIPPPSSYKQRHLPLSHTHHQGATPPYLKMQQSSTSLVGSQGEKCKVPEEPSEDRYNLISVLCKTRVLSIYLSSLSYCFVLMVIQLCLSSLAKFGRCSGLLFGMGSPFDRMLQLSYVARVVTASIDVVSGLGCYLSLRPTPRIVVVAPGVTARTRPLYSTTFRLVFSQSFWLPSPGYPFPVFSRTGKEQLLRSALV